MRAKEIIFGLLCALILSVFISGFASSWPDGLERVAEDRGFLEKADEEPVMASPIPDYAWPGMENERLATGLAGGVGTLLTFGIGYGLAGLLKTKKVN